MNIQQPLVSVVIPVYNVAAYIEDCLKSVFNQSYSNLEILIIDDASPDHSIALAQQLIDKHKETRARIISQQNRGLAGARNTGIRESQGHYIALLDSDDVWTLDKIEKHVAQLESAHSDVSFSASLFINENGESLNKLQQPYKKHDFNAAHIFCRNPIGNGSAPVIKRTVFQQICFYNANSNDAQFFDEQLRQSEDIECWARIALTTGAIFSYIDEPLTLYRLSSSGLSANVDTQFETWQRVKNKLATIDPDFIKQYGELAQAYQYRYLARRLIIESNAKKALLFTRKALSSNWSIVWREPMRTLTTLAIAVTLRLMPKNVGVKIVNYAMSH